MRVLFAHGLESGPEGNKSLALRDAGFEVLAPDCRGLDLNERIETLRQAIIAEPQPPILVGSSYGGMAGLCAAILADAAGHSIRSIVLCAPALGLPPPPGVDPALPPPVVTEVVHGQGDEVIPIESSRAYCLRHGVRLHEVDDDHRLAGRGLVVILERVKALS